MSRPRRDKLMVVVALAVLLAILGWDACSAL